jgi:acetyl-CoA/propionyl-CoA carboxylase biotin carboxyl carrier protein
VRLDTGVRPGSVVAAGWDPLLAKLVITGASRSQALHRAARALAEAGVDGVATTLPFHRALVAEPAFTEEPMRTHVRWVEDEFVNTIPPSPVTEVPDDAADRETVVVEVNGKRIEVSLPAALAAGSARTAMAAKARRRPIRTGR